MVTTIDVNARPSMNPSSASRSPVQPMPEAPGAAPQGQMPGMGQVLGGLFSPQMMPLYAGMALGGTRQDQGRLAVQGLQAGNELTQQQAQFAADQQRMQQEAGALERYNQARLSLERQRLSDAAAERNRNPFLTGIGHINGIPSQYLGDEPDVRRQQLIDSLFKEGEGQKMSDLIAGETSLRKEINALPEVQLANDALRSYQRIGKAVKGSSGPDDIALIFNYMKMLDPTSVVRETEYATAASAGGVPDSVWRLYNKAVDGEQLSPDLRQRFLSAAQRQAGVYVDGITGVIDRYRPISDQYGYTRERVLPSVPDVSATDATLQSLFQKYGVD